MKKNPSSEIQSLSQTQGGGSWGCLADIAEKINAKLQGDPQCWIDRAEPLATAQPGAITFLASSRYLKYLTGTQASAVILRPSQAAKCPTNALIVANPELAFMRLLACFHPAPVSVPGIHPSAIIGQNCYIDPSAQIGPHCVLEDGVRIGAQSIVGAGTTIGARTQIGASCLLYSRVTLYHDVILGDRVTVHSGAVIGADGFGFTHDGQGWVKIPQIGGVIIGNDVEIGANTTIDRGALQNTVIGNGVKLDNLVMVAHNVTIGDHTAIAGCTGIAGSTKIGKHVMIGGGVGVSGHIDIADRVVITAMSGVARSITEPGAYSSGVEVQNHSRWQRNMVRLRELDEMAKRLGQLEKNKCSQD